jgi:hypothetical protein
MYHFCVLIMVCPQVHKMESELRHKLFPPNAWMKVLHFNVFTSCPKDELHQWFIGLYGEHIIPDIVHRYTKVLQRPDLVTVDKDGNSHPLLSNEAVARVFKRLADRLQGVVSDTPTITDIPTKLLWTWCSLVPLRICTFKPLAPWRPME